MISTKILARAVIPNNGGELTLSQCDEVFAIRLTGVSGDLMTSRMYSSELALAELGCSHLTGTDNARVLVGGLGMGYTLSAALDATTTSSEVMVAELVPEIIEWNRGALGECAGNPLDDPRVRVHLGDVGQLIRNEKAGFDAILLDVDNGPEAFTHDNNGDLYSIDNLHQISNALRQGGVLAVWSAWHDPSFTKRLRQAGFQASYKTVRAHKGRGSKHTIYLAKRSADANGGA